MFFCSLTIKQCVVVRRLCILGIMVPGKDFPPFTPVFNPQLLDPDISWYVVGIKLCGSYPMKFFSTSTFVRSFPNDFKKVKKTALLLSDGRPYQGISSSEHEVVASTFGLIAVILRQHPDSAAFHKEEQFKHFRRLLNGMNLNAGNPAPPRGPRTKRKVPAARRLQMVPAVPGNSSSESTSTPGCYSLTPGPEERAAESTAKSSGGVSPNTKDIVGNPDIDTPEKALLVQKRGQRVMDNIHDVCANYREDLPTILGHMCVFGDTQATGIVNDIVHMCVSSKGVKRTYEDVLGENFPALVQSLRVLDWVLLLFKTRERIFGATWQAVINCTKLGRTGVSLSRKNFFVTPLHNS